MARKKAKAETNKSGDDGTLSKKDYAKELRNLHVELVKLQEWVKRYADRARNPDAQDLPGVLVVRVEAGLLRNRSD